MSEQNVPPGTLLNEYEIQSRLGAGGMGEVYLARDLRLERTVALKLLQVVNEGDRERVERFATEARAASALNHPNVAHVYGIGQAGPYCFIAMEHVRGQTLRNAKLEAGAIADIVAQAADALAAAHGAGIIHRDIKPANIMVTEAGLVKVLDFGLAKRVSTASSTPALTQPGIVMGTLGYMSPEQLLGRDVDHRTDVFSLGVVLYELLAGKLPFAAESYQAALADLTGPGTAAAAPAKGALARVALRCIERDPGRRYQTAAELAQALRAAKGGSGAPAGSRREWIAAAGLALAGAGFASWRFTRPAVEPGPLNSLAVLPFAAGGRSSGVEYLSEGIAESLMNRLSSVTGLRVMSRDSAFRHRDLPAIDAGRKLAVRGVVAGAIRQVNESLVVSAELVETATGARLWGGEFEGSGRDVLSFRDRIASAIAHKLELKLAGTEGGKAPARETEDSEAHDLYLRGRFHTSKLNREDIEKGIGYFHQAIELDPDFALAHAGTAEAWLLMADLFVPAVDALPKAREAAAAALESDPQLADGHVASGMVKLHADLDWTGGEASLRKAIELNPALAVAHGWLGWLLAASGRREPGLESSRKAVELEPRSPLVRALLAANLYFAGSYREAFSEAGEALEIDPTFHLALYWRGMSMIARGLPSVVAMRLEEARKTNHAPVVTAALGRAYAAAGRREKAARMLEELEEAARGQHVSAILFAGLNAALRNDAAALDWLERAYETRAKLLIWVARDPVYAPLGSSERFQALLTRMKLAV